MIATFRGVVVVVDDDNPNAMLMTMQKTNSFITRFGIWCVFIRVKQPQVMDKVYRSYRYMYCGMIMCRQQQKRGDMHVTHS
jgi:hypothetical protein